MRGRELVFAITCAIAGAAVAYAVRLFAGSWPSPVIYYSMIVIGLGAALVAVRYGRLGPFEGEFGTPGMESDLRERITRETDRSMRYSRQFTVVAVRQRGGTPVNWHQMVRGVDLVIACRRGLVLLFLPETGREGALIVLRRATALGAVPFQAALVSCPADGRTGDDLSANLLRLVRQSAQPGQVLMRNQGAVTSMQISA